VTHPVVVAAGLLLALVVLAELVAVPLATRAVGGSLGRCVVHRTVTIEQVRRPVLPRLLVGRARDVVLRVEDAELEGLRIDEALVELPHVVLPWAPGDPEPSAATVHLRIDEAAIARRLGELAPFGIEPAVELEHGVARVGLPGTGLEVRLTLTVRDGVLVLQPSGGPPAWWDRLGLAREIPLPPQVRVGDVAVGAREVTATLHVDELPGVDGDGCAEPVAADGPVDSGEPLAPEPGGPDEPGPQVAS
jgi:hypothetical protein